MARDDDATIDLSTLRERRKSRSRPMHSEPILPSETLALDATTLNVLGTLSDAGFPTASLDTLASVKATVPTAMLWPGLHELPPRRRLSDQLDADPEADFALDALIGRGGVGSVHKARQRGLSRFIALKRLRQDKSHGEATRASFITEAVVTAHLDHPHIVAVHELAVDQHSRPFYTMKQVRGQPWSEVLPERSLTQNLDILLRVCDAVAYAHSQGVLHRDLKPSNVMIGDYGEVVVMDWGLAAAVPQYPDSPAPSMRGQKGSEVIAGTPAYMAPEMARGEGDRIGVWSDIYLLGAILFEILDGRPPHDGETVGACLRSAAANQIVQPRRRRGELLRLAYRAMEAEPDRRFVSVADFQIALRDHLAHAESMHITDRAAERLDKAMSSGDYHAFAQALYGFEEALELWPGNPRAVEGRGEARWAYAAAALEKSDLDLAAGLIAEGGEELADLARQLHRAQDERKRRERAEHRLQRVEETIRRESQREWHVIVAEDFRDESFRERWDVHSPHLMWHPGELRLWAGSPSLLVCRTPVPGDVRLSFQARLEGDLLNDISCFLSASPSAETPAQLRKHGYEFKFGGYENTRICLYRAGTLLEDIPASPLEYGRTYQVVAERVGAQLRLLVDGQVVIEHTDDAVLVGGAHQLVGIVGWQADYCYSDIKVERLGAPMRADLLDVAADHLARGHVTTAIDLYEDVAASAVEPRRRQAAQDGLERSRRMQKLAESLGTFERRIRESWPGASVRLSDDGLIVGLRGLAVKDLEPLRDMPIKRLDCGANDIESLEPLQGLPLSELRCDRNKLRSLSPLRGMPLSLLDCSYNRIKSLAPLSDLPLEELRCDDNKISDLDPLADSSLVILSCCDNAIESLSPLAGVHLFTLHADGNAIRSLQPLVGSKLHTLTVRANQVEHIAGLEAQDLKHLDLADNRLHSVEGLRSQALQFLDLDGNPLQDLGPFVDAPPRRFSFFCSELDPACLRRAVTVWGGNPVHRHYADRAASMLALRNDDLRSLRRLARPVGNCQVLLVPERWDFEQAIARAAALGGRLACPATESEIEEIGQFMPEGTVAWIGIRGPGARWLDGRECAAHRFYHALPHQGGTLWSHHSWRAVHPATIRAYPFIIAWPSQ